MASGLLLGLSFPPIPTGVLAFVAFVPLFFLFESIQSYGRAFRYAYVTFFVFNAVTLYWTGGFTHARDIYLMMAGGLLLIAHPLFFCVPVLAWTAFSRRFGYKRSLMAFPFFWVSSEYLHSLTQVSFPWNIIGNSQSYDLTIIQFISFTGVYALSFWILIINIAAYFFLKRMELREWRFRSPKTIGSLIGILLIYILPMLYGLNVLRNAESSEGKKRVRIGMVQPNIDPFEKWQDSPEYSLGILEKLTNEIAREPVDLVIWPETAIPLYILHPNNVFYFQNLRREVDSLGINLLTGIPDIYFYHEGESIPKSSKISSSGRRYDTYNSSMLLEAHTTEIQKYAKMNLVPFAERVPFSEVLSFLNAIRWNFGLGGWAIGQDTTVFHFSTPGETNIRFSNLICYESIYPGFVASFVRKGAQFLTVITNDSWWGNTSGAYQHKQFAVLRAIENRRWVVQCANGGVSCIVDPYGFIVQSTEMYTQRFLIGDIGLRDDLTFYARHGDWFAEFCLVLSMFMLAAVLGSAVYSSIRKREQNEIYRPPE